MVLRGFSLKENIDFITKIVEKLYVFIRERRRNY